VVLAQVIWGAVCAAAPEIVRLFKQVSRTPPGIATFSWWYLIVSAMFIALGGYFAMAWNDNVAVKCIGIGASLPLIVSAFAYGKRG
jgi:hypothetical protein